MSKLNSINFTDYLNDSDSETECNKKVIDTYSNNEEYDSLSYEQSNEKHLKKENVKEYEVKTYSENEFDPSSDACFVKKSTCSDYSLNYDNAKQNKAMNFSNNIANKNIKVINEKDNGCDIRNIYFNKKIEQLELIGKSFKKIGQSIEYYKYNLENSKDVILREPDDEAIILLNDTSRNLFNIILLEVNKNLKASRLRFITIENVNLYEIPKIEVKFDNGIIIINIIENKKIYNYTIGCNYNESDDLEEAIDSSIYNVNEVYSYFNSRFNKISTIINYIKINTL